MVTESVVKRNRRHGFRASLFCGLVDVAEERYRIIFFQIRNLAAKKIWRARVNPLKRRLRFIANIMVVDDNMPAERRSHCKSIAVFGRFAQFFSFPFEPETHLIAEEIWPEALQSPRAGTDYTFFYGKSFGAGELLKIAYRKKAHMLLRLDDPLFRKSAREKKPRAVFPESNIGDGNQNCAARHAPHLAERKFGRGDVFEKLGTYRVVK